MVNTTATSVLKKEIQTALIDIGNDIEVLKHANIKPEGMRRLVEKYEQIIPDGELFNHFYDKYKSLLQRVEDIEKKQEKAFQESIQGYFKAYIEAAYSAGQQLTEIVKKHPSFSVHKIYADLNILNQTIKIMVLVNGNWPKDGFPSEEDMNQLNTIESNFFDLEEEFTHSYKLDMLGFNKQIQIRIETHWLLADSRIDTDSLNKDYPICVILKCHL